ncbi:MAG: hypothetical protein ABR905_21335, partial [Terracidiphilus sp.]
LISLGGLPIISANSTWLQPRASISSLMNSPGGNTSAGVLSVVSTPFTLAMPVVCKQNPSSPVLVVVLNADDCDHFIRSCPLEFNNQSPLLVESHGVLMASIPLKFFKMERFQVAEVPFIQSVSNDLNPLAVRRDDGLRKSSVVPWIGLQPIQPLVLKANLHCSI